jgi:hypothetical protein
MNPQQHHREGDRYDHRGGRERGEPRREAAHSDRARACAARELRRAGEQAQGVFVGLARLG